jgi:Leucine-rich repeat (LRR) protein
MSPFPPVLTHQRPLCAGAFAGCPATCDCLNITGSPNIDIVCERVGYTTPPLSVLQPNAVSLSLSHNNITQLPADMLATSVQPTLLRLYFVNNRISDVSYRAFRWFPNLELLLLSFNLVATIPPGTFEFTPNLVILSLSYNSLTMVPQFPVLPKLSSLYMEQLPLTSVFYSSFSGIAPTLNALYMKRSLRSLFFLSAGSFLTGFTELQTVDLSENSLTSLPDDFFSSCVGTIANVNLTVGHGWFCSFFSFVI